MEKFWNTNNIVLKLVFSLVFFFIVSYSFSGYHRLKTDKTCYVTLDDSHFPVNCSKHRHIIGCLRLVSRFQRLERKIDFRSLNSVEFRVYPECLVVRDNWLTNEQLFLYETMADESVDTYGLGGYITTEILTYENCSYDNGQKMVTHKSRLLGRLFIHKCPRSTTSALYTKPSWKLLCL